MPSDDLKTIEFDMSRKSVDVSNMIYFIVMATSVSFDPMKPSIYQAINDKYKIKKSYFIHFIFY